MAVTKECIVQLTTCQQGLVSSSLRVEPSISFDLLILKNKHLKTQKNDGNHTKQYKTLARNHKTHEATYVLDGFIDGDESRDCRLGWKSIFQAAWSALDFNNDEAILGHPPNMTLCIICGRTRQLWLLFSYVSMCFCVHTYTVYVLVCLCWFIYIHAYQCVCVYFILGNSDFWQLLISFCWALTCHHNISRGNKQTPETWPAATR